MLSEAVATFVPLRERAVVMVQFRDISAEDAMRQKLQAATRRACANTCRTSARASPRISAARQGAATSASRGGACSASRPVLAGHGAATIAFARGSSTASPPSCAARQAAIRHQRSATASPRRDGVERWLRITCRRVEIDGELNGVLVHFRDVSDEIAYGGSAPRRGPHARITRARYNAMGEMATAIAHELSQPLAAIPATSSKARSSVWNQPSGVESAIWGLRAADRQAEHAAHVIKSVREFIVKREPVGNAIATCATCWPMSRISSELRARDEGVAVKIEQCERSRCRYVASAC